MDYHKVYSQYFSNYWRTFLLENATILQSKFLEKCIQKIDLKTTYYVYHIVPSILLSFLAQTQTQTLNLKSKMSKPVVLETSEWNPASIKYMAPKTNERGGKAISMISKQTNRSLHISTPLLMTWGISDFVDEKTGESDGKYSLTLAFPNDEYSNPSVRAFLQKLKDFETQILKDAVANSEAWWGEEMELSVCKHTFFPFLKYSRTKDGKKLDYSKPPSIRAKVPYYDSKWNVELYDTKSNLIFPSTQAHLTPVDFVPKQSQIACVLQCGGIWIGGKGWGLTWKLVQGVVKPREIVSVFGKCHIKLSEEDRTVIETQKLEEDGEPDAPAQAPTPVAKKATQAPVASTHVEDSDDEEPQAPAQPQAQEQEQEQEVQPPVETPAETPVEIKPTVKKVVKKAATPASEESKTEDAMEEEPAKPAAKKIVKKKPTA